MAKGLMDLVNKYRMGKEIEGAREQYEQEKYADTRMTQRDMLRKLESAGLGSTPVGYEDPHNRPLWEFEGVGNPWEMKKKDFDDFLESGEWDYPNEGNFLNQNEIKAQLMADYDIIKEGSERASDRMDKIVAKSKSEYEKKSPNLVIAIARKLGLGQ